MGSKLRGRAGTFLILLLGLSGAPAGPDDRPTLLEDGFRVRSFPDCGLRELVLLPPRPARPVRDPISDIECSPGGPWGDHLYMAVTTVDRQADTFAVLERVDPRGKTERLGINHRHYAASGLNFGPLGWRGGDLLFFTRLPATPRVFSSVISAHDPGFVSQFSFSRLEGHIGTAAVDPSGDFEFDLFYQAGRGFLQDPGLFRVDASGAETLFSGLVLGEMRFGPGGPWGSDLYVAGLTFAPDGTHTRFPAFFTEFDWAFGPGLDGDMFAHLAGEDSGILFRVKPDGTSTPFAMNAGGSVAGCRDALWLANLNGCFVVEKAGRP